MSLSPTPSHRTIRALLVASAAGLATCSPPQSAVVKKIIEPGNIELAAPPSAPSNEIWGSFLIKQSTHPTAIESPGTGGACLIADLNYLGIPAMPASPTRRCSLNADCQGAGIPAGGFGYCDIKGDKKCWVRPGPPIVIVAGMTKPWLCNISPTPRPENTDIETAHLKLEDLAKEFTYDRPVRWRVVACLNGPTPASGIAPCRNTDGGNRLEVMGAPRAVPPPG